MLKSSTKSFQNEYDQLNKQNHQQIKRQQLTRGKRYSIEAKNERDQRHESANLESKKVLEDRINKTSVTVATLITKKLSAKLDDLYLIESSVQKEVTESKLKKPQINQIRNSQSQIQNLSKLLPSHPKIIQTNYCQVNNKDSSKIHYKIQQNSPLAVKQQITNQIKNFQDQVSAQNFIKTCQLNQNKTSVMKIFQQKQKYKFQNVYPIQNMNSENLYLNRSLFVFEQFSHVMKKIKKNYLMEHSFHRHKSCMLSQPIMFELPKTKNETITSQKVRRFWCSQFKIYLNKNQKRQILGTLRSNFTGSIYNFIPASSQAIYFSILFPKNKNAENHIRYSQIYINKNLELNEPNQSNLMVPYKKLQSLEGLYGLNANSQESSVIEHNQIYRLKTKLPNWSDSLHCYQIDFGIKGILPSTKNTIFIDDNGKQVIKFYKDSDLTYKITFQNPISWIVAYGYSLACTDFKLATQ